VFVFVVSLYIFVCLFNVSVMYRDIIKTKKNVQRHYKDKQKCTDITKTKKNVQRHYKDKQKCTETFCLSLLCLCTFLFVFVVSLYIFGCLSSVSVHFCLSLLCLCTFLFVFVMTNKNVQRHYKDKHKWVETLQWQTQMYRDITKTNFVCLCNVSVHFCLSL
jgi:hypothetical protein